ncbi:MAG TPA: hypothetical protein VGO47_05690 [Chlamydiales bacterium]|nr:hypothetical protein [Chlamydiales bacterium]
MDIVKANWEDDDDDDDDDDDHNGAPTVAKKSAASHTKSWTNPQLDEKSKDISGLDSEMNNLQIY